MEMYIEDRARMNAMTLSSGQVPLQSSSPSANQCPYSPPPPPPPPSTPVSQNFTIVSTSPFSGTLAKPKPILIDKQSSEPNTPIARNFDKQIQRGNSDLGQRIIKKRVTLRHSLDTTVNRCSSAGISRPVTEAQRSTRSDSSIGPSILISAPAIKLETDIEANYNNAQNDSRSTLLSSADSVEHEIPSESSTLGTEVESLCVSDEIVDVMGGRDSADFDFIDDIPMGSSSRKSSQESYTIALRQQYDQLLIPEVPDTGNESDCDLSTTTVVHAEHQSLMNPMTSETTKLHPQYHHHPHHTHHHAHHHYKTSHDNL